MHAIDLSCDFIVLFIFDGVMHQIEKFFNISLFDIVSKIDTITTEEEDVVDPVFIESLFILAFYFDRVIGFVKVHFADYSIHLLQIILI